MRRLGLLGLALIGCAGAPPAPAPSPLGGLPDPALAVGLRPAALSTAFDAFEARLHGGQPLGPLLEAWGRARQAAADAVAGVIKRRAPAPTVLEEWGVDPAAPLWITIAAPEAPALGRAVLASMRGAPVERLPAVVIQARVILEAPTPERLAEALVAVAGRFGIETWRAGAPRPAWLGGAPTAGSVRALGRDPETGALFALRWQAGRAAVDVVVPPAPGPAPPLLEALARAGAPVSLGEAPLYARLQPGLMAGIEVALDAHLALRHPDPDVRAASGAVLTACTERWQEVAAAADFVDVELSAPAGRPSVTLQVSPTTAGRARWRTAARPLPLSAPPAPIGWQIGWRSESFGPVVGPGWIGETGRCGAGHPMVGVIAAAAILPTILTPAAAPPVEPPAGFGIVAADAGAGGVVGATAVDGVAVPHLVGLLRGSGGGPLPSRAPDARRGGERRWAAPGALPTVFAFDEGPPALARFGVGPGALGRLAAGAGPPGVILQAQVDAATAAAALRGAGQVGPEVEALGALGARLGRLSAAMTWDGGVVTLRAAFEDAAAPSGVLDRRPPQG